MTASEIVANLFNGKPITKARIAKAQGLALRSRIEWQTVLIAMTTEQQQKVEHAE